MIVTQQFINDFIVRIRQVNPVVRLEHTEDPGQTESSMLPLLNELKKRVNQNIVWESEPPLPNDVGSVFEALFKAIRPEKQRKYAVAIKFLLKSIRGENSYIFRALHAPPRRLSVKLSKSQQRYTVFVARGDPGYGVCLQTALLWLREQLSFHMTTSFPRLKGKNVVASRQAYELAEKAMAKDPSIKTIVGEAERLGLIASELRWGRNFLNIHESFDLNPDIKAILITLWDGRHAIAIIHDRPGSFLFYDGNAGSYRVQRSNLREFMVTYNEECLPLKWPGYHSVSGTSFTKIFSVTRK
ncbi:hypothetical protein [Endozoicomonas euniceicola]|uniref:Peptidase C58 YopT-type domain-containing protein n=1 Tax=Endozoicomonas euniceicola TaxID=1234143 RepID=A0ABY6GQ90_9GAMM|nr:hypothetical protein [Endozoicomonas euniceicola]UYM14865.1 hypothetical protein NX720_18515 [Endozoicomonas euniceicola]